METCKEEISHILYKKGEILRETGDFMYSFSRTQIENRGYWELLTPNSLYCFVIVIVFLPQDILLRLLG